MQADTAKDVRWFSFYDHAVALDPWWHTEAMTHAFALFTDGKNPWSLHRGNDAAEDAFSARVNAWHVGVSAVVVDMSLLLPGTAPNRPMQNS